MMERLKGHLIGIALLILLSPAIAMALWVWLGFACAAAWLLVGPIDYCVATYADR